MGIKQQRLVTMAKLKEACKAAGVKYAKNSTKVDILELLGKKQFDTKKVVLQEVSKPLSNNNLCKVDCL